MSFESKEYVIKEKLFYKHQLKFSLLFNNVNNIKKVSWKSQIYIPLGNSFYQKINTIIQTIYLNEKPSICI